MQGLAYEVQSQADADKLAVYETSAYRTVPCRLWFEAVEAGKEPEEVSGTTFLYAGDRNALREGDAPRISESDNETQSKAPGNPSTSSRVH